MFTRVCAALARGCLVLGVALAPIASISATHRSLCCTRIFMPLVSARVLTGFFTE